MVELKPKRDESVYADLKLTRTRLAIVEGTLDDLNESMVGLALKIEAMEKQRTNLGQRIDQTAKEFADLKQRIEGLALLLCAPRVVVAGGGE